MLSAKKQGSGRPSDLLKGGIFRSPAEHSYLGLPFLYAQHSSCDCAQTMPMPTANNESEFILAKQII